LLKFETKLADMVDSILSAMQRDEAGIIEQHKRVAALKERVQGMSLPRSKNESG
jgi:hypothetical protein